jgi:hypothetical protein
MIYGGLTVPQAPKILIEKCESQEPYQIWLYWCPGCDSYHQFYTDRTDGQRPEWKITGPLDSPTVTPSILYANVTPRCHCFIKAGKIQFLNDCTHHLKGQTVDMVDVNSI